MSALAVPATLVKPEVALIGEDGNAFSILGRTAKALRKAGNSPEVVKEYTEQATSGDYDHLLRVTMAWTEQP